MPAATKTRRSTSKTRTGSNKRNLRSKTRREVGVRKTAQDPRIIADSVFALTLAEKLGFEVHMKMGSKHYNHFRVEDNFDDMYRDLLVIAHKIIKEQTGTISKFDPLASGLDFNTSMAYIIGILKNELLTKIPNDFDFNVDRDDDGYYFTIFIDCSHGEYWHYFELKPVIKKLERYNPGLLPLFYNIIHQLCYGSSFPSYWNEGMGYAEYMVDEEIEYWDDRYDGEDNAQSALENALAEIEEYKSGKAFEVATKIRKQKPLDPKEILSELSKFKSKSPIVRWMVNACNFLFCPGIISDYIYQELEESDEAPEGLKFDQQVCIIWDINDIYSKHQSDCLDAETSGCGVYAPLLNYRIDKKFEKIDLNDIMERMQWPRKISELFQEFEELTH